jgi:hypothetical protein
MTDNIDLGDGCDPAHFDEQCVGCHEKRLFATVTWIAKCVGSTATDAELREFTLSILDGLADSAPDDPDPDLKLIKGGKAA